jgi:curved DNA-binding protein
LAVAYRDYYKTLGISKTATEKEIKAAYRKLARKHHPDMNQGKKDSEAKFKEINEAHEVLSDPEKRRRYDTLGENWQSFQAPQNPRSRSQRTTINIELSDGGSRRRVEVKIPPGVREGSRVRVSGEGRAVGSRKGDLYLRVRILPHATFKRNGEDLEASISVPLTGAVLGGEAQIPTLDGAIGIKVPAGTPVGRVFRLRGHGLPKLEKGAGKGDLLATLSVAIPTSLSKRERELFEELQALSK